MTSIGGSGSTDDLTLTAPLLPHGGNDPIIQHGPPASRRSSAVAAAHVLRRQGTARRRRSFFPRKLSENTSSDASSVSTAPISNRSSRRLTGDDDDLDDLPRDRMTPGAMVKVAVVVVTIATAIGAYVTSFVYLSMTTLGEISVAVAGGVTVLHSPFVLVKEWKLAKLPTFRRTVNELMKKATLMKSEVNNLAEECLELEVEIESVQAGNAALEKIVQDQNGGNVDEMVQLIQENQHVLHEMKENLRQVVIEDTLKTVLRSDADRSGVIHKREAEMLAKRLAISLDVYGIVFDTDKFLRVVGLSPSLPGVMRIVKRLLPEDEDARFLCERHATFYSLDRTDSEATNFSDDEDHTLDCVPEGDFSDDEDDVLDMFYLRIDQETKKGSAEAICGAIKYRERTGKRPNLMSVRTSSRSLSSSIYR